MTNLYTGVINTNGEYKTLSNETGLTFESDKTYVIQIQNQAWLREGATGDGFLINRPLPIQYTKGTDDLYIKTYNTRECVVNIAD